MTSEPLCIPVCFKCRVSCHYAVKESPKYRWKPDEVMLVCGETIIMPISSISYKGKVWCEKHGRYERKAPAKKEQPRRYPERPLF